MNLRDTISDFGKKITPNFRDIRYCRFAPPSETAGVIDVSSAGDGSRGIAFLTDRLIVKLDGNARQMYYKDIRVMEILSSYETPFEDELLLDAKAGEIRISDCSMNKFFLRQLISNVSRITATMRESERAELLSQLAAEAREYYPDMPAVSSVSNSPGVSAPEPVRTAVSTSAEPEISPSAPDMPEAPDNPATDTEPLPEAAAAVQEIAAAKKAALAAVQNTSPIEITEEKIEWISGKSGKRDKNENTVNAEIDKIDQTSETVIVPEAPAPASAETPVSEKLPQTVPAVTGKAGEATEADVSDLSHEQTISYLLDSIAEINSAPEQPAAPEISPERSDTVSAPQPEVSPELPKQEEAPEENPPEESAPALTKEPESTDIYILASRRIREMCEEGRLTMEQVNTAVKEQLVPAAEIYSRLDAENAPLPPAVKSRARQLTAAADRLTEYFALGEDVAARVMFFMLYQMLSYTDRIVQSDETKQALNYFFVRFGPAGIILSMLEANN